MENNLGVVTGIENGAIVFEVSSERLIIDEVAIVDNTNRAKSMAGDKRLDIF